MEGVVGGPGANQLERGEPGVLGVDGDVAERAGHTRLRGRKGRGGGGWVRVKELGLES